MKGHVILETRDAKSGRIRQRVEGHNTITPWVANAITKGDFGAMIDRNKIQPLAQNWFGGCLLTDAKNPNGDDVPGFFGMIGAESNVVAMAGDDAYTGTNHKRGSADFTAGATGPMAHGYRFVWRWSENQGNGHIESVCLTRPNLGKVQFIENGNFDYEDDLTLPKTYANDRLSNGLITITEAMEDLSVIDYEREKGFKIYIDNYDSETTEGDLCIEEYALNTWHTHIIGASGDVREKIGSTHIIHLDTIKYYTSRPKISVSYTGGLLHVILFPSGNGKLIDYVVNPEDYTALYATYDMDYTGISFCEYGTNFPNLNHNLLKDAFYIEYEGNKPYLYGIAEVQSVVRIVKCNLLSSEDVTDLQDDPLATDYNGVWIGLPNGDKYKQLLQSTSALYYHNGKFYKTNLMDTHVQGTQNQGIHGGGVYGTNIIKTDTNRDASYYKMSLDAFFPWVSTVYNLPNNEIVDKNISMTMSLVYELTES